MWENKEGFTLLEIMVAVVLISILGVFAISRYGDAVGNAKEAKARANLFQIKSIQATYNTMEGAWATAGLCAGAWGALPNGGVQIAVDADNTDGDDDHCTHQEQELVIENDSAGFVNRGYNYTIDDAAGTATANPREPGLPILTIDFVDGTIT